ncbi:MAG: S8 family serine peptidase [Actinobacteria bacterium]|nr:S8 family serine peptidase [Actinomycetota bacterium]
MHRRIPLLLVLPLALCLLLIEAVPALAASSSPKQGVAGAKANPSLPPAPTWVSSSPNTPHRPKSCTPLRGDPNTASPGQVATPTGTVPWPPVPVSGNPQVEAALDHTPRQFPPLRPANWAVDGNNYMLTSARSTNPELYHNPQELCGVRGNSVDTAWQVTTGSPRTVIAVTDSGIEWCDPGIVDKIYLNTKALPPPENAQGLTKAQLERKGVHFADLDPYDLNNSGIINVAQYANDPRVAAVAKDYGGLFCQVHGGPQYGGDRSYTGISPEDLIRTFGTAKLPDGRPNPYYYGKQSPKGFTEAIAGWNFVNNNNDPYDDVHYDHGTGEAQNSGGAANTAHSVGTCPNCMILPVRVGDSFISTGNLFAEGVLFAVDSGANVIQEALGTLNDTETTRQAVAYAEAHGVPILASAADEEEMHHNLPALLSHTIVVNSVTEAPQEDGKPIFNPPSYLYLNGCTNYGANIAVSVESSACSSNATGLSSGIVGLAESAAANAVARGVIKDYPGLKSVTGKPVPLSVNEIRQLVTMNASEVNFQTAAPPYGPPDNYAVVAPVPTTRYRSHPGYNQYFGYGRIDAAKIVSRIAAGDIPPEAQINNLPWFQSFSPGGTLTVEGMVGTPRSRSYKYQVDVGIGADPEPGTWHLVKEGRGRGVFTGTLAKIHLSSVAALFPSGTSFTGGPVGVDGAPDPNRFTFSVRVVVKDAQGLIGISRRAEFLHSDPSLLRSFPKRFDSSLDAPPTLAPLGPGGTNVLIVATSGGTINAYLPNGKELPGWPVHTDPLSYHPGQEAFLSHSVTAVPRGEIIGGVAVGNLYGSSEPACPPAANAPGPPPKGRGPGSSRQTPRSPGTAPSPPSPPKPPSQHPSPPPTVPCSGLDVVAGDLNGNVYAWNAQGKLLPGFPVHTDPAYSSMAAANADNRVLPGIFAAPALADLEGNGELDIVASSEDRHVYAWQPDGKPVPGWPVLVVDPAEVASVNPITNQVTFKASSGVMEGTKLIDTPAIGNLSGGSGPPDVIVGSNEQYAGAPNISIANPLLYALGNNPLLTPGNSRVYSIYPDGNLHDSGNHQALSTADPDSGAMLPGWPVAIGEIDEGILPDVGNGVVGSPALADLSNNGQLDVAVMSVAGPVYLLKPNGSSYLGSGPDGKPKVLSIEPTGLLSNVPGGQPSIPALGGPALGSLGAGTAGISVAAPAASLGYALNEAFPADQHPHPLEVDAWSTKSGHFDPGFPQAMNDLQFLDEPIIADVGGAGSGPYVIEGSATYDLRAVNALGQEAPGFPKFTGGWMVNSASVGPLGRLPYQVVTAGTREGNLFVWETPTPSCASSGPWPREHHDLWNTGNLNVTGAPSSSCPKTFTKAPVPPPGPGGTSPALPSGLSVPSGSPVGSTPASRSPARKLRASVPTEKVSDLTPPSDQPKHNSSRPKAAPSAGRGTGGGSSAQPKPTPTPAPSPLSQLLRFPLRN